MRADGLGARSPSGCGSTRGRRDARPRPRDRRRLVARRSRAAAGDAVRVPARRRHRAAFPTRAAAACPTACTGSARSSRPPAPQPWPGRELAGGVIYELHIGTFTDGGTLDAAIGRLDDLVDLGVDFVEPLPVNGFNGERNWGYDGVAWYAVDDTYGGPHAYLRFVDACHARGLGVIQDVVYNHFGPSGNYLPRFGPYLDEDSANTWGANVNLAEPDGAPLHPRQRAHVVRDVRGRRPAARCGARAVDRPEHILAELSAADRGAVRRELGRPLTLIAESDLNDPAMIMPRDASGYGMTAQWSDDYHHAVHAALTGETDGYYADFASLDALAKAATRGFVHDGTFSTFRGRPHGAADPRRRCPRSRLVTFVAGPRPDRQPRRGRPAHRRPQPDRLAVAAVLNLCSPFTPMIFMGEEWAASTPWQFFTAHPEPELGEATAEGRIAEFARAGLGPGDACPTRRTRRRSAARTSTGPSATASRTAAS